jgi:hypothetical protein
MVCNVVETERDLTPSSVWLNQLITPSIYNVPVDWFVHISNSSLAMIKEWFTSYVSTAVNGKPLEIATEHLDILSSVPGYIV